MIKHFLSKYFLLSAFIVPLFIYLKTMMPTVDFWDTGEFQTIPYSFDIGHPTGYPTYVILGKIYLTLFRFGEVAWRMNLLSGLYTSIGVFVAALTVYKITRNKYLTFLFSILISTNPILWSISTKADPHTLHFLFTTIVIYLIYEYLRHKEFRLLCILSLTVGLSLGKHMLSVFFIIPLAIIYIIYVKSNIQNGFKDTILKTSTILILFIVGSSVYLVLPIISFYKPPLTTDYAILGFENFKRMVFGQDFNPQNHNWIGGNFVNAISYYIKLIRNSYIRS